MKTGICKLYKTQGEILESHIHPKFAVEYMKKTGSSYLRHYKFPNKRYQDGAKFPLLSPKAEQLFGDREKWFSQKIFYPYLEKDQLEFPYNENLYFFALSYLWRILVMELEFSPTLKDHWSYSELIEVERVWQRFLAYHEYPMPFDRIYIQVTDDVMDHDLPIGGVNYYFTRGLDATIAKNDFHKGFLAIYGKFLKFIFWGVIKGGNESELRDLKINPIAGLLKLPQDCHCDYINTFYINRIKELESLPLASPKQQGKILEEIRNNKEKFFNSEAGRAILTDIAILERRKK